MHSSSLKAFSCFAIFAGGLKLGRLQFCNFISKSLGFIFIWWRKEVENASQCPGSWECFSMSREVENASQCPGKLRMLVNVQGNWECFSMSGEVENASQCPGKLGLLLHVRGSWECFSMSREVENVSLLRHKSNFQRGATWAYCCVCLRSAGQGGILLCLYGRGILLYYRIYFFLFFSGDFFAFQNKTILCNQLKGAIDRFKKEVPVNFAKLCHLRKCFRNIILL